MGRDVTVFRLLDRAERLRVRRKVHKSQEVVAHALRQSPAHPRALLLQSRLFFEQGNHLAALEALKPLMSDGSKSDPLRALRRGLERLVELTDKEVDPAFATESMAQLLVQQGYLLEAMEVNRRLYLSADGEARFWEELLGIRERLRREGSREKSRESLNRELEAWDRWLHKRRRGS